MCQPAGALEVPDVAPELVSVPVDVDEADAGAARLREMLGLLDAIGRATARVVDLVGRAGAQGDAERLAGVALELVLGVDGRQTRSDRRMLLAAADVLARMPVTAGLFRTGRLSWGQVRAVVDVCKRLPSARLAEVDEAIGADVEACARSEPDELVDRVVLATGPDDIDEVDTDRAAARGEFVALQPRLDGGGTGYFEYADPVRFAEIADRLDADATRLVDGPIPATRPGDPDGGRTASATLGRARAAALHAWAIADRPAAHDTRDDAGDSVAGAPVRLQVVVGLETLLGRDRTPGWLLTRLAGGRLRLSGGAARRLVDARGGDVRAVVVDGLGRAVGVGRRTRIPPGWLRDAITTLDPTCTAPGCRTAARVSQVDHAVPWTPRGDGQVGGSTDVHNLHVACQTHNLDKAAGRWTVTIGADATRTWTAATGWSATTIPATRPFGISPSLPPLPPVPDGPDPPG